MTRTMEPLLAHKAREREATADLFRAAMAGIEAEMAANGGIYPHARGKLSIAEVCRRAGRTPQSIQKPHHAGLKAEIDAFLARLASQGPITKRDVDAARKATIASFEAQLRAMAADRVAAFEKNLRLEAELAEAQATIAELRAQLSRRHAGGKVVAISGRG